MKRLSLQWRIPLMSVLLIGITCVAMNLLLLSLIHIFCRGTEAANAKTRMNAKKIAQPARLRDFLPFLKILDQPISADSAVSIWACRASA